MINDDNNKMIDHDTKTINTWWMAYPHPGNFGDILTPWLIKTISGYDPQYVVMPFEKRVLLGVGSILEFANKYTTVWGSGLITAKTVPSCRAKYLAVRGPITYELLNSHGIVCPKVFGDPALLMPRFYNKNIKKKYKIGIFPNYIDGKLVSSWWKTQYYGHRLISKGDNRIKIINPLNFDPTKVIDSMLECENIVSSSLHGLIAANAYGIPSTWVKFSNKIYGDDSKYHDHFGTMKVKHSYTELYEKVSFDDLIKLNFIVPDKYNDNKLLHAFPSVLEP